MKIALVIQHADPARGGAERYTIDLAEALVRRGHEVSLLASSFAANTGAANRILLGATAATRLGRYLRLLDALDAHLSATRYDIVHAMLPVRACDVYHPHAGLAAEGVATGHRKHSGGVARISSWLGNHLNRKRRRFAAVERRLLSGPHPPVVLCLSDYVKRSIQRHYPLPPTRLATLFNAVDLNRFSLDVRPQAAEATRERLAIPTGATVALMIAQDYRRKGLRQAILATARANEASSAGSAADNPLVLVVVGKENPTAYQRLARHAGIADRVIFAGATDDPGAFYRAADFFVLPTRHDPCSLVVLEALAMGLPVISTAFNGACEIMADGQHGFVLSDPDDIPRLARAMSDLRNPELRGRMRQSCLALRPSLSQDVHLQRLLDIYQSPRQRSLAPPVSRNEEVTALRLRPRVRILPHNRAGAL